LKAFTVSKIKVLKDSIYRRDAETQRRGDAENEKEKGYIDVNTRFEFLCALCVLCGDNASRFGLVFLKGMQHE
jgi:hypothetical protein